MEFLSNCFTQFNPTSYYTFFKETELLIPLYTSH